MSDTVGYGFASLVDADDATAEAQFLIKHQTAQVRTVYLAEVVKVYAGDPTADPPTPTTVDIKPVVQQMDAQGKAHSHDVIYGVLAARIHAGSNALLIDPEVGDVGVVHVSDRDISKVVANGGKESAPGSLRRHAMEDGVFHGGVFTKQAKNLIDLRGGNISITTPGDLTHTVGGTMSMSTAGGPATYNDGNGNEMLIDSANKKICTIPKDATVKVYLGGDPKNGGVFGAVSTTAGPSDNVFAHVSGPL